ncbi:CBO0543 family protein [Ammoniphilus sp. 3BR4]|uniref:CBO0543 family protein n=1 Tax=Ammoniphilus sp. 3BR4 TaxID=3158265 RepID=UPI003466F919
MFFIGWFVISWVVWFIFADKKRWREIIPVCTFAGFLGATTDTIVTYYPVWEYKANGKETLMPYMLDDFGIYVVVVYLFIQWLPEKKSFWRMIRYFFYWTAIAISIETIFLMTKHIEHIKWWKLWHSYAADWFLFWLFYKYHKILRFNKLSDNTGTN